MTVRYLLAFAGLLMLSYNINAQISITNLVTDQVATQVNTGSVELTIAGGTSPYTYAWSNSSTTKDLTGISAGSYTVTVTDAASVTATKTINILYQIEWKNVVNANTTSTDITKSASTTAWDAGASSENFLAANTGGYLEYKIVNVAKTQQVGFSRKDYNVNYNTIRYGFQSLAAGLYIYESGVSRATLSACATGDLLKIERIGSSIKYYRNGTLLRTVSTTPSDRMIVDVSLYTVGTSIGSIHTSFGVPFLAYADIIDDNPSSPGSGSIVTTVKGGTSPYSYSWADGPTTADRTGLNVGTYTVTVTDATAQTFTSSFIVSQQMTWTNLTGQTGSGHSITKTSVSGFGNSSAFSDNFIEKNTNGYLEWEILSSNENYWVGLAPADYGITGYFFRYGIIVNGNSVTVNEGGTQPLYMSLTFESGDVLRIERNGTNIYYKRNNVTFRTVTSIDPNVRLYCKAMLNFQNSSITEMKGLLLPYSISPTITDVIADQTNTGAISLTVKNGVPPYTYSWADGSISSSRTGLPKGNYTLTVTDANSQTVSASLTVNYRMAWTNTVNVATNYNSLVSNAAVAGATSLNLLKGGQDGYLEFEVVDKYRAYYIGFNTKHYYLNNIIRESVRPYASQPSWVYEGGMSFTHSVLETGDVIRIERSGNNILYKKNGTTYRTTTDDAQFDLFVDAYMALAGEDIRNIRASFGAPFRANPTVTDVSSGTQANGAINLSPIGGVSPYSYAWADGSTSSSRANLAAGSYTVTVTGADAATVSSTINVVYSIVWVNTTNVSVTPSSIVRNGGTANVYDAGGMGINKLSANTNGYIEFEVPQYDVTFSLGFLKHFYSYDPLTLDHGWSIAREYYATYDNAGTTTNILRPGDIYRIERNGSNVIYKINGVTKRTVSTSASAEYYVLASIYSNLGIMNARTSIPPVMSAYPIVSHQTPGIGTNGTVMTNPNGGLAPYTFQWSDGGNTSGNRTGLSPGTYTVTITDGGNNTASSTIEIGYQLVWDTYTTGVVTSGNSIKRTTATLDWTAGGGTKNYLAANQDGYVQFEDDKIHGNNIYLGLSQVGQNYDYTTYNYAFYKAANDHIYISENATLGSDLGLLTKGDVLRISRIGSNIVYTKNGTALRTIATDATKVLGIFANLRGAGAINAIQTNIGNVTDPNTLYWTGKTSTVWSNTGNWSFYSNGPTSSILPSNNSTVVFNSYGNINVVLSTNVTVNKLNVKSGYTASIVKGLYTLTVLQKTTITPGTILNGSGHLAISNDIDLDGGTIDLGGGTIDVTGELKLLSGQIKGSGTLTVSGGITMSGGSIDATASTFTVAADITGTSGEIRTGGGMLTINGTSTINGLTTNVGAGSLQLGSVTLNSGSISADNGTLGFSGNVVQTGGTLNGNTAALSFHGTLTLSGGTFFASGNETKFYGNVVDEKGTFYHNNGITTVSADNVHLTTPVLNTLNIESGNTVHLDAGLQLDGRLTLNSGKLDLGGNTLRLLSDETSTVSASSGGGIISDRVDLASNMLWPLRNEPCTYTIPFVTHDGVAIPVTFEILVAGETEGSPMLQVATYPMDAAVFPNNSPSLTGMDVIHPSHAADRYWLVNCLNYAANPTVKVKVSYCEADMAGLNSIYKPTLQAQMLAAGTWTPVPSAIDTLTRVVEIDSLTGFGLLALSDGLAGNTLDGKTCARAFEVLDSMPLPTFAIGDSVFWFTFTATDSIIDFTMYQINPDIGWYLDRVTLFGNDCSSLTFIAEAVPDTNGVLALYTGSLFPSERYYVKVTKKERVSP